MTWIYLVWSSVSGRGANGVITNYTVEVSLSGENENSQFTVDANDPRFIGVKTITFNITGLRACTPYMVRVAASTSVGRGPYSEWVDIKTSSGETLKKLMKKSVSGRARIEPSTAIQPRRLASC